MLTVKTQIYTVTAGAYVSRIMSMWLQRHGWILIVPFGFCGCMAFYRWEWIVVGIALLLLIYPFILSFVYFRYGLSPESRHEIAPRRVTFTDSDINIEILKAHIDDQEQKNYMVEESVRINYSHVRNVNHSSEGITLRLKIPRYAHIFVPSAAFENQTDIDRVRNLLDNNVKMA